MLTKALRYQQQLYRSQRLKNELSWYESQPLDYRAQFVDKFVAVCNHAVIDHDSDRHALNQRISQEYGSVPVLVIPAEGPREIRVYSPKNVLNKLVLLMDGPRTVLDILENSQSA